MPYQLTPMTDIEGIGDSRAQSLKNFQLVYAEDLLKEDYQTLYGRLLEIAHFPLESLHEFRSMAELNQVHGLTCQHAEALVDSKIRSLTLLANTNVSKIKQILDLAVSSSLIPDSVDEAEIINWQKEAVAIHYTGYLFGEIIDENGPVQGAKIIAKDCTAQSDSFGRFWLPIMAYGKQNISIVSDGHKRYQMVKVIEPRKPSLTKVKLTIGQDPIIDLDEARGDVILPNTHHTEVKFVDVDFTTLSDDTPLILRYRYQNGDVKLNGVLRRMTNEGIEIIRVKIAGSFISESDEINQIYIVKQGQLEKVDKTIEDFRRKVLTDKFGAINF